MLFYIGQLVRNLMNALKKSAALENLVIDDRPRALQLNFAPLGHDDHGMETACLVV